jgi:hypothetical protein
MTKTELYKPSEFFKSDIPSVQISLLKKLKNSRVRNLVRYSWDPPNEIAKQIEEDLQLSASSLFRRGLGCLLITLESGLILGFGQKPSESSVRIWVEQTEHGQKSSEESILDDNDFYPLDASDKIYSEEFIRNLIGEKILSTSIIRDNYLYKIRGVAGEVGVVLKFKNNSELIISINLCNNINDFDLILRDEIDPDILEQLQEISVES